MTGFAATAALLADPARAAMLSALLPGEALTAGELARVAGIAPSTATQHFSRLLDGGLILLHTQGRHRYFRLAGEEVAHLLETLGGLQARHSRAPWPHGEAFRTARLCWNHVAGRLGVALHEALAAQGLITPAPGGWACTPEIETRLNLTACAARDCMDWSERRPHLAGALATQMATQFQQRGWLRRLTPRAENPLERRRLALSPEGARQLRDRLGIAL